ncbi:MAG: N-glycosylase/DNA lyase [Candidatus ainarchaeum sp.]|nr:N-glycosylase/DNA lyase [Candidatus ainarchaeum sp.]
MLPQHISISRERVKRLLASIGKLRHSPVSRTVNQRMSEFRKGGKWSEDALFGELCFCLLTANFNAERAIAIQEAIGDGFITLPQPRLAKKLKQLGYRFPNTRARYIMEAREHHNRLRLVLASAASDAERREWLADNVLGLGYKEASHFLRNTGHSSVAIIDFHIVDVLAEHGVIKKPKNKSLSRKHYLEIEHILASIAKLAGLTQGELDLYLWYMETGKVLK